MRHDMLCRFFRVNLRSNCRLTLKKISIFAIYIPDIFHKKAIKADFSVLMAFGGKYEKIVWNGQIEKSRAMCPAFGYPKLYIGTASGSICS